MWINRCYIILILTLFGIKSAKSQEQTLTESFEQKIYFREAYRYVELSYRNNHILLNRLKSVIDSTQNNGALISINIQAWASPKGAEKFNELLAHNRTNELAKWIIDNCHVTEEKIIRTSGGVGWNILRELVAASDVAYKESVIGIIDNTPVFVTDNQGNITTGRRKQLMEHDFGHTWMDMQERFFPNIRCGLAVVVNVRKQQSSEMDTVKNKGIIEQTESPIEIEVADTTQNAVVPDVGENQAEDVNIDEKPFYMAIRTNLLEDVFLVPNIGMDFYLGKGCTIGANWKYAWWNSDHKHRYWRVYGGDINVRKYFGRNAEEKPLQGHHIGLYGQIVTYDFKLGGTGIMGGIPGGNIFDKLNYGGGIEYGYSHPIAKRLNLDFTIGLGYFGGQYREYESIDDCYVWKATKHRHYWGPTKAEVSLVWLIGRGNVNTKKGGAK